MTHSPDALSRQGEFRKELGLRNLALSQVICIMSLYWVGSAAKLGAGHLAYWVLAVVLFYLPSAAVVIYLNRIHPLEGGVYEWSRLGYHDLAGFLVGWNYWINSIAALSTVGIQTAAMLAYALGPQAAWMSSSKPLMACLTIALLIGLVAVSFIGLSLGKWIQDFGGFIMVLVYIALIALLFRNMSIGRPLIQAPFTLAVPSVSLMGLNLLGKMSFGAMSGLDSMAVFAGESRDASRTFRHSVLIAAPLIAILYILGTGSVVAMVPHDKIDLVSPISQALTMGTGPQDPGAGLIPLVIAGMLFAYVGINAVIFSLCARLPLVAGWDHLLPEWFGRLHPSHKTPTNAILVTGVLSLLLALATVAGSEQEEAFQLLQSGALILFGLVYLVMFSLPLFGRQREIEKPPLWLQAASVSGFLMTLLYVVLSLVPIIDVSNPWIFTVKIGVFIIAVQLIALGLYFSNRRRSG